MVLIALGGCRDPQTEPGDRLRFQPHVLETTTGDSVHGELAFLAVPERHGTDSARTIQLAVMRLRGAVPAAPPIVYLAGGPGSSGIDAARGPRLAVFEAFRAVADVILLDQRGTGRSQPVLNCPETAAAPLDRSSSRADALGRFRAAAAACTAFWRGRGVDLGAYHTQESVEDLAVLGAALGVEKLALFGVSYGTHLGLAAIRRYPDLVAKAIFAGLVGPDDNWKLPSVTDSLLAVAMRLDPTLGPDAAPDLARRIAEVAIMLDADPARTTVPSGPGGRGGTVAIGGFDFRRALAGILAAEGGAGRLPGLVLAAAGGDLSGVAPFILRTRTRRTIGSAMGYVTLCASGVSPGRREQIATEVTRSPFGAVFNIAGEACDVWGAPDLGETFRAPVQSAVPTLLISGSDDFTTPPADAERVLRGLDRGEHLIIEGVGHGNDLLVGRPEFIDRMVAFLRRSTGSVDAPAAQR